MTRWLWLFALPLGSVLYAGIWLRRKWIASEEAQVNARIAERKVLLEKQLRDQRADESLPAAAARRRAVADEKRRQARQIESGHVTERPRIVRPGFGSER